MTLRAAALLFLAACSGTPALASTLDLAPAPVSAEARLAQLAAEPSGPAKVPAPTSKIPASATPSPATAALRSLILPGWGQLATGHDTQAAIFGGLELATWVTYATFERQGALRRDSYFDTAQLFAGIDLGAAPESYRKLVGQYRSSDVYNQYVVLREANYFYEDPTERAQYIASRSIPASDAWNWGDNYDAFLRYGAERRSSEQAYKNGQYTLGFAIINRMVSAVMAARAAAELKKRDAALEGDAAPGHPTARLAWQVTPGPGLVPDARVACIVRF